MTSRDDRVPSWRLRALSAEIWGAAGVLLVAATAYLWNLGAKSLWLDEAVTLERANLTLRAIATFPADPHPPLYYSLMHFWVPLAGVSEWALRLPSVVFGLAGVGLFAWLARDRARPGLGLLAMGLMALSPLPVMYAQTARGYSLLLASTIGSYVCLVRYERRPTLARGAAYVLASLAMSYTHYYGLLNVCVQQLYLLWRIRNGQLPAASLLTGVGVLLGYLVWIPSAVRQLAFTETAPLWHLTRPDLATLVKALEQFVLFGVPRLWLGLYLVLVLAACLRFGRKRSVSANSPSVPSTTLLTFWLVGPVLVATLASWFWRPVYNDRYIIGSAPALYLLVSRGVWTMPRRWMRGASILVMLMVALVGLRAYYPTQAEDWRALSRTLETREQEGDVLLVTPPYLNSPFAYYYGGHLSAVPLSWDDQKRRTLIEEAFGNARAANARVWHVGLVDGDRLREAPAVDPCVAREKVGEYGNGVVLYLNDFARCGAQ